MHVFLNDRKNSWCVEDGTTVRIGRAIDCKVRLFHDTTASRYHCRLSVLNGMPVLEDTGSTHGTFVNDESINSPTRLRDGDTIRIGFTEFTVEVVADSARVEPSMTTTAG